MKTYSVLIADDDAFVRNILSRICKSIHWTIDEAASGHEALEKLDGKAYHIYVLDVKMPGPSGLELAKIILQKYPSAAVLILTGYAEVEQAVGAIKKGVFDYIQKDNVENEELERILLRAAEFHENRIIQMRIQEEREQSLKDIERSNQEFQAVLELSSDLIFIVNAKSGDITDCNKAACERLGYSRAEILSCSLPDVISDFQGTGWSQLYQSIRQQSENTNEGEIITRSKQKFSVDVTYAYVCLETGEYLAVIARDITGRKKVERELEEQRKKVDKQAAKLQTMIENMDEGILLADSNGTITEVNSWFTGLAKTPKEFILKKNLGTIIRLITGCDITNLLNDFKSGKAVEKECIYADIFEKRFMVTVQPILQQEEFQGIIVNLVDISDLVSEQKRSEKEIQYHKNSIANAAKDIQTPLEGILAISSQLSESKLDESQKLLVEMIQDFARSLSHLVSGMNAKKTQQGLEN